MLPLGTGEKPRKQPQDEEEGVGRLGEELDDQLRDREGRMYC
jgi:hypothetical protein